MPIKIILKKKALPDYWKGFLVGVTE